MINVYSNSNQTALHFLLQNAINLDNTIIITGNFNIRNSDWDSLVYHHFIYTDDLLTIADSLGLEFSSLSKFGPYQIYRQPTRLQLCLRSGLSIP